jgi:hypothetical protein
MPRLGCRGCRVDATDDVGATVCRTPCTSHLPPEGFDTGGKRRTALCQKYNMNLCHRLTGPAGWGLAVLTAAIECGLS